MEHKDWCNSRATCVCDHPSICERAWNAALKYNKVVDKTAHNTGSPKLPPCDYCGHPSFTVQWVSKDWNFCPQCGRQLRASA